MKAVWTVLIVLAFIIIVVSLVGFFYIGTFVKMGIEDYGPQIVKVPVHVAAVDISVLSGTASVKGLVIENPPGCSNPDAIKVGTISIHLDPFSLTSNKILIHSVRVESPEITYERAMNGSNLSKILNNVNSSSPSSNELSNNNSTAPGKPAPTIEIDDFVITGAKVNVGISGVMSKVLPLPEIHLTNLGKNGNGLSGVELAREILKTLLTDTIKTVIESVDNIKQTITGLTGTLTGSLGGLFGK